MFVCVCVVNMFPSNIFTFPNPFKPSSAPIAKAGLFGPPDVSVSAWKTNDAGEEVPQSANILFIFVFLVWILFSLKRISCIPITLFLR